MRELEGGRLHCTVEIQQSPMFIAWCCSFGTGIKVVSPPSTIQLVKEHLKNTFEQYD
jgi:hypothetical protein